MQRFILAIILERRQERMELRFILMLKEVRRTHGKPPNIIATKSPKQAIRSKAAMLRTLKCITKHRKRIYLPFQWIRINMPISFNIYSDHATITTEEHWD